MQTYQYGAVLTQKNLQSVLCAQQQQPGEALQEVHGDPQRIPDRDGPAPQDCAISVCAQIVPQHLELLQGVSSASQEPLRLSR